MSMNLVQFYSSIKYIQPLCFPIMNMRKDVSSHLPHKYLKHFHLFTSYCAHLTYLVFVHLLKVNPH